MKAVQVAFTAVEESVVLITVVVYVKERSKGTLFLWTCAS